MRAVTLAAVSLLIAMSDFLFRVPWCGSRNGSHMGVGRFTPILTPIPAGNQGKLHEPKRTTVAPMGRGFLRPRRPCMNLHETANFRGGWEPFAPVCLGKRAVLPAHPHAHPHGQCSLPLHLWPCRTGKPQTLQMK